VKRAVKNITDPLTINRSFIPSRNPLSSLHPDSFNPILQNARHVGDYRFWLKFADGREGIVDFSDDLWGDDLTPLRDLDTFAELSFDDALATLTWERGGIDISPNYLYSKLERLQ
jgi:Protein of unknown function (DUF2442)